MGKKKRNSGNYIGFERGLVWSEAFKGLSANEFRAYFLIKSGHTGENNGDITMTYKQMENFMKPATFSKAIKSLEEKGWIKRCSGGLNRWKNTYELTWQFDKFGKPKN